MSSIRLLILGVLSKKQPIHGYDIRRELESLHADRWANIGYGSIYSALGKMTEEGLVVQTNKGEKQTAKTEYVITPQGKAEFDCLLHEYWWKMKPTVDPFQIALAFMDNLPPHELQEALRHRAISLQDSLDALNSTHNISDGNSPISIRLMRAHIETELRWIEETLRTVECNTLL
jgi:DNA-binding PadR family transcriptional regulator